MDDQEAAHNLYYFGPFCLSPQRRLLLERGKPVRLGSRALDMLMLLLERHGELVTKQELTARVWPATVVVEGNLTAQLAALRRALRDGHDGHRYILNDPGRGYRFVAPVAIADEDSAPLAQAPDPVPSTLMRVAELCYGFVDDFPPTAGLAQNERVAMDAMLQRGIQALEFARTLVASEDFDPRGHTFGRLARYRAEPGNRPAYPAAAQS